jgi:hypothetical protein
MQMPHTIFETTWTHVSLKLRTKKKKEKPTKNLAGSKKIPPEVSNLARIGTPPRKKGEGGLNYIEWAIPLTCYGNLLL